MLLPGVRGIPLLKIVASPYASVQESIFSIPPIVGIVSDIFTRKQITPEEAIYTPGYQKLLKLKRMIEETFIKLDAWKAIFTPIS